MYDNLISCFAAVCSCRERQRGLMASLEAELEGKMGQLQLLAAENEMLKLRAAVLESTVASREVAVSYNQAWQVLQACLNVWDDCPASIACRQKRCCQQQWPERSVALWWQDVVCCKLMRQQHSSATVES
jgi:hypothetical protein